MFVARENEFAKLNKFFQRQELDIVALYGRRRVGKTELLRQFVKDKNHIFFSAEETTDLLNLEKLSELYSRKIGRGVGIINTWEVLMDYIADQLLGHFGRRFEIACTEYIKRLNQQLVFPELLIEIGTWWGGNPKTKVEEKIDIVGLGDHFGLYCECKYKNTPVSKDVLDELMRKSMLISKPVMHYYIISKSGFTDGLIEYASEKEYINLVTLDKLFTSL